ncbi:MAG: hypothetical protein ACI97N_000406 [Cognaticolwellia sp.]|jgi:hypothetical protein
MLKYTNYTLKKFEAIFEELEYTIRYEKGSFQSGYCIVKSQKVIVVNKFFDTEAKINCLTDILDNIEINEILLSDKSQKFTIEVLPQYVAQKK